MTYLEVAAMARGLLDEVTDQKLRAKLIELEKAILQSYESPAANLEFVSYDGEYPNLCSGTFVFDWNGERHEIRRLSSGGSCGFNSDYSEEFVEDGPWDFDDDAITPRVKLTPLQHKAIRDLINDNVSPGCCGGCL
jgi:hypothetical protein